MTHGFQPSTVQPAELDGNLHLSPTRGAAYTACGWSVSSRDRERFNVAPNRRQSRLKWHVQVGLTDISRVHLTPFADVKPIAPTTSGKCVIGCFCAYSAPSQQAIWEIGAALGCEPALRNSFELEKSVFEKNHGKSAFEREREREGGQNN